MGDSYRGDQQRLGWTGTPIPPRKYRTQRTRASVSTLRAKEVRANNYYYQEISTRKENHTSHDQFKSAKLQYFANLLSKVNPKNHSREKKIQPKESPTLLVVRLTRYRRPLVSSTNTMFPSSIHSPNGSSVMLCSRRCCWEKEREK